MLFCFSLTYGQLSNKHYIPPLTSAESGNALPGLQYIYISTPSNQDISYSIKPLGQTPAGYIHGIVNNASPAEVFLGNSFGQLYINPSTTSTIYNNKGYIIEASEPIYASIRTRSSNDSQAAALVSKGELALGTTFRAGSFTNENASDNNYLSFISVLATQDNTAISFDDLPVGLTVKNYTGTFPIQVTLDEGETYVLAVDTGESNINKDGLIGALIESNYPIAVNTGSTSGSFSNTGGRDFGIDQIVDLSKVGNEYIFVKGSGSNRVENPLIVAHTDNTIININGVSNIATINAGEYYVIEGDNYSTDDNMYVSTSQPVFAYQGIGGLGNDHNQGFFFVPPLNCENRTNVNNIAHIEKIGAETYTGEVIIITNNGATVTINDSPINTYTVQGPFTVPGKTDYVTYKVTNLSGNIAVKSNQELYCAYINTNTDASSGSFYSGFPSPPQIDFSTGIATLGNCIPNIILSVSNIDFFDSYEWYYDDGSGFVSTNVTSTTFTPLNPGKYKLAGIVSCTGLTLESEVVVVSNCPNDFDNDGIIDNVDIDTDNDGISNLDESLGNGHVDISNISTPVVVFPDATTNNAIVSSQHNSSNNASNNFQGTNNGVFYSLVAAGFNAEQTYKLTFTTPVNATLQQESGTTHTIVAGEVFTVSVSDLESITLTDPDNQLLVDTNFDGIFELGVNTHTASEIRFIYNNSPLGNTPYRFSTSKVNEISFHHALDNMSLNSEFRGRFQLVNMHKDTDGDGNSDDFDVDSDNDGIPDLIEANATITTLLNTDSNSDGLDNVFAGSFVTPIDSDRDTIPDYLDLDADNDGIFDLFEAGHGLPDADLNGVIDNINSLIGNNGFADGLETSSDSFLIGYTITDSDSDNSLNYTELDSDNDNCFDVIEAGFTDNDTDGLLGDSPVTVDSNGLVTSATDGYTVPNSNYIIYAPITLNTPFQDVVFCEGETASIFIDATADSYQWQLSTDGSTWSNLSNDAIYNGVISNTLTINNLTNSFDGYEFRVLMQKAGNSCGAISNSITLSINPLPIVNNSVELIECDDNLDGISSFNLLNALPSLSSNHLNEIFTFYTSLADAQNDSNPILTPNAFVNSQASIQNIWVRVTSNTGCYTITSITLRVPTTQIPSGFLRTFNTCDDFLDTNGNDNNNNDSGDGISSFDFSSVTTEVLAMFPSNQQLSINYYRTEQDAINQVNPITDTNNYRNIGFPNNQQIYIRIQDLNTNSCVYIASHINLLVDPVPQINPTLNLELCDIDGDGFVQGFDLDSKTADLLAGQNPLHFSIRYYTSEDDAINEVNPIINTSSFDNTVPFLQTIYVRIVNNISNCFSTGRAFDLITVQIPNPSPVSNMVFCDDNTDGIISGIDLDSQIPQILGSLNPSTHQVSFHTSLADAETANNPINSPFTNTTPFSQTIYVRITNNTTGCFSTNSQFDIIINPEPQFLSLPDQEFCDDDTDGLVANIDLNALIPQILNGLDPSLYNISFHISASDANSG
ncbi:IgGFc-binding protein, partial [Pseudotenacibaculum haliotis]